MVNLAGVAANGTLQFRRACTSSPIDYNTFGEPAGIRSIGTITLSAPENGLYLVGPERVAAFGDTFYRPSSMGKQYTVFGSLSDFLLAFANTTASTQPAATFGFTDRTALCFHAAGIPPASDALQAAYSGRADGVLQTATGTQRLFGSKATLDMSTGARTGNLRIELSGYSGAFPAFDGQTPGTIGNLSAALAFSGNQIAASNVAGPGTFTGSMSGQLVGTHGVILVFELKDAAGSILWGSAALDNADCKGCWDY